MKSLDWNRTRLAALNAGITAAHIVTGSALGIAVTAAVLSVTGLGPTVI